MKKGTPIYVEIFIRSGRDTVWEYTQNPEKHEQWDLRFSGIEYLPRPDESVPQRFLYQTNIGFGLTIKGEGESTGALEKESGEKTSSLRFWTDNPISLIKEGSGYWKYVPEEEGTRFFTQYDYKTRFGSFGAWLDVWGFRPLIGWATAWSFDCLRLWLEKGIPPKLSFMRSIMQYVLVYTLAFVWIYQGVVPKILYQDVGELDLLQGTHLVPEGYEPAVLSLVGGGEILFGLCFLFFWRKKALFVCTIILLVLLGAAALLGDLSVFAAPFNPVTLNVLMISFSLVAILNRHDLPDAKKCKRTR